MALLSTLAAVLLLAATLLLFLLAVAALSWSKRRQLWHVDEDFISARGSQQWWSIGLSLFAGAMGAGSLTAPPETAAIGGCWAAIGYAIAMSLPWSLYLWAGPRMRDIMGTRGFTALEFLEERFGRRVQLTVAAGSVLTMWVFMVAELTAIGACLESLSPDTPAAVAIFPIAAVTTLYSALGGLHASLLTDKIQALMTILLVLTCYTATFTLVAPEIEADTWSRAFHWDNEGIVTGLCLVIAALFAEVLNQATWQRVFASRSAAQMKFGFLLGSALVFLLMLVFGAVGNFGRAAALSGYIDMPPGEEYNSLFLLLAKLPRVWLGVVLVMATGLVASTVDSLQTGMSAMIASTLLRHGKSLNWARLLCVLLNIPAVIYASFNPPSILQLLVAGNVVSTALGPAMLLGFRPWVTSNGILLGVTSGLLSVPCIGWWRTSGDFVEGLKWFQFPNGYNWECLLTFGVEILVTVGVTILVSLLEKWARPRAYERQVGRLARIKERTLEEEQEQSSPPSGANSRTLIF